MESMTLREAARRTSRSVTTLRRYIRGGKLPARKRPGRFGPEYFVVEADLIAAGLELAPTDSASGSAPDTGSQGALVPLRGSRAVRLADDSVPLALYRDLQMKHEQLLVQYGMVRAGGLRAMEIRDKLDASRRDLAEARTRIASQKRRYAEEKDRLCKLLRQAELEQQGRGLEIDALKEKVRALEMLTRNAVMNESIEEQFSEIRAQARKVENLSLRRDDGPAGAEDRGRSPRKPPEVRTDH